MLRTFRLGRNEHNHRGRWLCVMEATAMLAGERHTDRPQCACPVITTICIMVNDKCRGVALREELLGDMPWRLIGTRADDDIAIKRRVMLREWVQEHFPALSLRSFWRDSHKGYGYNFSQGFCVSELVGEALICYRRGFRNHKELFRSLLQVVDQMIRLTEPQERACEASTQTNSTQTNTRELAPAACGAETLVS